jgi:hypothetical protein
MQCCRGLPWFCTLMFGEPFRHQGGFWSKHLWVFLIRASDVPTSIHSLLKILMLFVCFTVGVPSWTCSWYFSSWPAMGSSVHPRGTFEDASEHYWSCVARKQLKKESKMWWMWIPFTVTYPFCFSCRWTMSPHLIVKFVAHLVLFNAEDYRNCRGGAFIGP